MDLRSQSGSAVQLLSVLQGTALHTLSAELGRRMYPQSRRSARIAAGRPVPHRHARKAGTRRSLGLRFPSPIQRYPNLDTVLKFAAAPAVLVFGLLFIAYRNYYTRLGIDPEDVGIDNMYILSRSAGFLLLIVGFMFCAVASQVLEQALTANTWTGWVWPVKFALSLPFTFFLAALYSPTLPPYVVIPATALASASQTVPLTSFKHLDRWATTVTYLCVLGVGAGLLATALVSRAHYYADQVLRGCEIESTQILSIPVLDLSTSHVVASWTGSDKGQPKIFGDGSLAGVLIGRGDSSEFILSGPPGNMTLVRVPSAMTIDESNVRAAAASACSLD